MRCWTVLFIRILLSSQGAAFNVLLFRFLTDVAIAAAPVMDESAGLAAGNTSFGGKDERVAGLFFLSGAFLYL